jgi:hypothetical protein
MSAKIDLHDSQAESLKSIWLSQAKKFSEHAGDLRVFLQSAHRWSDIWHATIWGMPGAVLQRDFFHRSSMARPPAAKRRARADRQTYGKKMTARFPGTGGHRQR